MTSSRNREDIATIFDVFCEVGAASEGEKFAPLLTKYPEDYNEESILKSIRQFAFPCSMKQSDNEAVQLFSFVLTDSNSKYSFGFCRYTPRNDTCICLLSGYFWPNVFYKALNQISLVMNSGSQDDMDTILTRIYHTDLPNPGDFLRFEDREGKHKFEAKIPDLTKLPTLREDKYMLEFYNAVSPRQMIAIYSSLLKERRIMFTGRKLSQLSSCIHACSALLYPMFWQSVFIPVLPASLSEMIMAPMPYLIGVPKQIMEAGKLKDIGEIVVIDIDEKTLESPFDDISAMPNEVVSFLKSQLKNTSDMNDSISRTFLRANVILFGDYRSGFVRTGDAETMTWKKDKFVSEQRSGSQQYLGSLLGADGVQYLERFIHERQEVLRLGLPVHDEFELEIEKMDLKNRLQVRENASDVIGALKDKVSGIQIGNKLNKLTPKEIRKSAGAVIRKKTNNGFEPMSFENLQWETARDSFDETPVEDCFPNSNNVPVANLIDFDSPVAAQVPLDQFDPFAVHNRPLTSLTAFNSAPQLPHTSVFNDPFSTNHIALPPSSTASSSSQVASVAPANSAPRTAWEQFDN